MTTRRKKGFKALAVFTAFALLQISMQLSFAAPAPSIAAVLPQGLLARVTTEGNAPVSINGISSPSGSSIASGTIVETGEGVKAIIDLGALGTIELAQRTRVQVNYACPDNLLSNPDPEVCQVTYTVFFGCVTGHYKKGSRHQIDTPDQQRVATSDREKEKQDGGTIPFCKDSAAAAAILPASTGIGLLATIGIVSAALILPPTLITLFDEGAAPTDPSGITP